MPMRCTLLKDSEEATPLGLIDHPADKQTALEKLTVDLGKAGDHVV